jgi:Ca2+-binding EF-hand superfamily protein
MFAKGMLTRLGNFVLDQIEEEEPTGFIRFDKFESLMQRVLGEEMQQHLRDTEEKIIAAFKVLDVDKKGYLEPEEFKRLMSQHGEKFSQEEVRNRTTTESNSTILGPLFFALVSVFC